MSRLYLQPYHTGISLYSLNPKSHHKMSRFKLSILSLDVPALPNQPPDAVPTDFHSPLQPSPLAPTSPMTITLSLSPIRASDPLHPATHLQLAYTYKGTGDIFMPDVITAKDLLTTDDEGVFMLEVQGKDIPRAKVSSGGMSAAVVNLYAWKGEKLLGRWQVGTIEGLGIVGMKPHRMATSD